MSKKLTKQQKSQVKKQPLKKSPSKGLGIYTSATICFIFSFLLYANTFKHSYVLDDYSAFADNWVVKKGVEGIPLIIQTTYRYGINLLTDNLYRPFSQIMFAVEWQISPNNPYLSHVINVFFYALSCFLLLIVLRKYLHKIHPVIPLLITLIFSVHPIHTEVVANIKSRDEIMSFFFLLLTLLLLHKWFSEKKVWALLISVFTLLISFFSKEGVVTMLFIFPIIGWYFTDAKPRTILAASLLMIIPAIIYIGVRYNVLSKYSTSTMVSIVDNYILAIKNPVERFATSMMLLGKYLLLTVIPYQLVCDYSFNQLPVVNISDIRFILPFLIFIALGVYIVKNFLKKNPVVFGLIFFVITTSIYSNIIITVGTSFGERLMFLPSLGLCISFVMLISKWLIKSDDDKKSEIEILKLRPFLTIILLVVIFIFSVKTVVRASEWENQYTLFKNDVKRSPNSAHMHLYWGLSLRDKAVKTKDPEIKNQIMLQAVAEFDKSLSIYPTYVDCFEQLGLAWYRLNDKVKSLDYYNKALKLNSNNAVTWSNMGIIYFEQGDMKKAMEVYKKSISIDPNYADAHLNLGSVLGMLKKYDEALIEFDKAIQLDPQNSKSYFFKGITYQNMKNMEEAKTWIEKSKLIEQQKALEELRTEK